MPYCSIIKCVNRKLQGRAANRGTSYHGFPNDPHIKNKWIEATGRKNWFPTKNSRICSKHFDEDTFTGPSKYRRVIKTAYPTIDILIISKDARPGPSRIREQTPDSDHSDSDESLNERDPLFIGQCRFCGEFKNCVAVSDSTPYLASNQTILVLNDTSVQLDFNDDTLPKTVCTGCDGKLQEFSDFVQVVKAAQDTLSNTTDDTEVGTVVVKTECDSDVEVDDKKEFPVDKTKRKNVTVKKSYKTDIVKDRTARLVDTVVKHVSPKTECDRAKDLIANDESFAEVRSANKRKIGQEIKLQKKAKVKSEECIYTEIDIKEEPIRRFVRRDEETSNAIKSIEQREPSVLESSEINSECFS